MKRFLKALTLSTIVLGMAGSAMAQEYVGGWDTSYLTDDGRELLVLGDSSDDTYTGFEGTRGFCAARGDSYAYMRRVVSAAQEEVYWWVDADCGRVVRICVENVYGDGGCSSYLWDRRWW